MAHAARQGVCGMTLVCSENRSFAHAKALRGFRGALYIACATRGAFGCGASNSHAHNHSTV